MDHLPSSLPGPPLIQNNGFTVPIKGCERRRPLEGMVWISDPHAYIAKPSELAEGLSRLTATSHLFKLGGSDLIDSNLMEVQVKNTFSGFMSPAREAWNDI